MEASANSSVTNSEDSIGDESCEQAGTVTGGSGRVEVNRLFHQEFITNTNIGPAARISLERHSEKGARP